MISCRTSERSELRFSSRLDDASVAIELCHANTIHSGRPPWSEAHDDPVPAMPDSPGGFVTDRTTSAATPLVHIVGATATSEKSAQSAARRRHVAPLEAEHALVPAAADTEGEAARHRLDREVLAHVVLDDARGDLDDALPPGVRDEVVGRADAPAPVVRLLCVRGPRPPAGGEVGCPARLREGQTPAEPVAHVEAGAVLRRGLLVERVEVEVVANRRRVGFREEAGLLQLSRVGIVAVVLLRMEWVRIRSLVLEAGYQRQRGARVIGKTMDRADGEPHRRHLTGGRAPPFLSTRRSVTCLIAPVMIDSLPNEALVLQVKQAHHEVATPAPYVPAHSGGRLKPRQS